jgi:hypothetical protein
MEKGRLEEWKGYRALAAEIQANVKAVDQFMRLKLPKARNVSIGRPPLDALDKSGKAGFLYPITFMIGTVATDKSGLTDLLSDGTPHNQFGSAGSGIAYTGEANRYILVADRGPADGTVNYHCRMHVIDIGVRPGAASSVQASLVETVLLKSEMSKHFLGISSAFDLAAPENTLRLDPEGVRVGRDGKIYISDEYGPFIYEFDRQGKRCRVLSVPKKFGIDKPRADAAEEMKVNQSGRVTNRGFEGLAITPDGGKLYACMQSPLIQEWGRKGTNLRILEVDLKSNARREFVYPLENSRYGVSEILAVNGHEFLVLERDGQKGDKARFKKLFKIDISSASDISAVPVLPQSGLPAGIIAVKKTPFLDFLDPRFGLRSPDFPAKLEGLAFGPDLPDGRHLLLVTNDNDFVRTAPNWYYAFAIDASDLPNYQPQIFDR